MDKQNLQKYLQAVYPMPETIASELTTNFEYFSFPKGYLLLEENKVNRQSYFLHEGYVRAFTLGIDGKEVTTKIYSAVSFVQLQGQYVLLSRRLFFLQY